MAHLDAAHNLAFHLLRERADAQDAVQDAYVRAYRAFAQLQGEDIKPWLLTIVRNVCYRRLQERRRMSNVISLDETLSTRAGAASIEAECTANTPSPEQNAIRASDATVLTQALAALPPAFREVIVLRELEELSYREVADIVGAPIGTVMSRLSRARAELRALMMKLLAQDNNNAM